MRFWVFAPVALVVMGLSQAPLPAAISGVKVLLQFENPQSSAAVRAMQEDVIRSLRHTVDVQFAELTNTPAVSDGRLVVFKMKGFCTMNQPGGGSPIPGERLASAFVTDGVILPFGEILCDRVRASLAHSFGTGDPQQHEYQYGKALASVMRHELYHMLSGSARHTTHGVTREKLSALDLVSNVPLPESAARAMGAPNSVMGAPTSIVSR